MYKQIKRKMAPITPRTPRSNTRNSLTHVAVGFVEQHLVVSAVTQEQCMTEMLTRLDNMGAMLGSLDNRFNQFIDVHRRNIKTVLIREKIWKKDFRSNNPTEIANNEARQRLNVDEWIGHSNNVVVVAYLQKYIHAQPQADIYTRYWRGVGKEMDLTVEEDFKMAFFDTIQKGTMLDGKSDTEKLFSEFPVRMLKVVCPSWRSNKFNKFLGLIDESMQSNHKAKGNAKLRMPRFLRGEIDVAVPCWLILSLPS
ncbi:hypothetical protein J3Q64DRAFT_1694004 [Phycomyces blakesleeanus]|uniref:Uncharacterized protein n=2 Tax=Phycomyces blakesleeanus TaxID=4837 RepID=A0A167QA44_PHYB8|nr:hypothetical protein PHYBLDRAFT_162428 [Phycomyces blakesleeanus NRRL 1555(-)]OAD79354.1 hypothetical protein PHYBLDRAFT_162428 [Phycomyces blakesleeanus NRRL 1555(-)]|eukprot:XP_018297394.1 hypothetical protein PHYBLDRAFT_162428 [Phycomyces blakesleeanus NRRL 1555(-)]